MQVTNIILGLISIVLCKDRIDFNSAACENYLKKFGTVNSFSGTGPTSLSFTGDAAFESGKSNVVVRLRYIDSLYDDPTFWGLTQEDGKSANTTCLDLKLFRDVTYIRSIELFSDLPITASSNPQKKWRYLSFTINGSDLEERLQKTINSDNYVYIGQYAIAYFLAGTTQVQYTLYFQFSVTVSKKSGQPISTAFRPFNQYEIICGNMYYGNCVVKPSTKLQWCADATCSDNTVPVLYFNDQFYIQQVITQSSLTNYFLTNTTVYFVGNGLNKETKPIQIDNSKPGKVLLLLSADIVWSHFTIEIVSYLSTTKNGARLLKEMKDSINYDSKTGNLRSFQIDTMTYDPVFGTTDTIICIKMDVNSSTCPTCEEECRSNGFSREGCDECNGKYDEEPVSKVGRSELLALLALIIQNLIYQFIKSNIIQ